ncbi:MAG: cobyric acid synthase [Peptostreptococcaceae bacterium]|nr:cobyric acid synthase [Peptostreptococcaceae bacterium]
MKGIMIQGTSSDAGKSFLVTALCRIFANEGFKVCPFKSQNMSNNSYVTLDGCEIGRAQGVQAEAAKQEPSTLMNPILLKPKKDTHSEIVLFGKTHSAKEGKDYYKEFTMGEGIAAVRYALKEIEENFDLIVIEGAGSPVEMNLNDREIVNMRIANEADVPVILVTDIDRGGSMGSIVGTLELLGKDKKRVKGIIFNKFRGDLSLFEDGIKFIEDYTGVKVVGVMPYLKDIIIENEDNLSTDYYYKSKEKEKIILGVVDVPFVSNNTDIEIFRYENDVQIQKIDVFTDFSKLDAVIIPGTKSTMLDTAHLFKSGIAEKIISFYQKGGFVFGICGGYQMLGQKISDENNIDNNEIAEINGLALLPINTYFVSEKTVKRVHGISTHPAVKDIELSGYEIHLGQSTILEDDNFSPITKFEDTFDGLADKDFKVAGTYMHNIFHNDEFRNSWLNLIRELKGYARKELVNTNTLKEKDYEKLAAYAKQN